MIPAGAVYGKTPAGNAEVSSRKIKLERCSTVDDLRALMDPYREAIAKASGFAEADILSRRVLELLGPEKS